jgi:hypothetical protein
MSSILYILGIIGWIVWGKGTIETFKTQGNFDSYSLAFFIPFLIFGIIYGIYYAAKLLNAENKNMKDRIYRKISVDGISFLFITMIAVILII